MIRLLVKRTIKNKIYWLAILSALGLLLCSIVYTDPMTGESFTFLTLFYNEEMQQYLQYGSISMQEIHFDEIYRKPIMDLRFSYIYYLIGIIVCFLISYLAMERYDFTKIQEMEE